MIPANDEISPNFTFPFEIIIVPKHNERVCINRNVDHHSNQNGLVELFHCGGIAHNSKNHNKPNISENAESNFPNIDLDRSFSSLFAKNVIEINREGPIINNNNCPKALDGESGNDHGDNSKNTNPIAVITLPINLTKNGFLVNKSTIPTKEKISGIQKRSIGPNSEIIPVILMGIR